MYACTVARMHIMVTANDTCLNIQATLRRRAAQDTFRYSLHSDELFHRIYWCIDRGLLPAHEHRHLSEGDDSRFFVRTHHSAATYRQNQPLLTLRTVYSLGYHPGSLTALRTLPAFQTRPPTNAVCHLGSNFFPRNRRHDAPNADARSRPTILAHVTGAYARTSGHSHKNANAKSPSPGSVMPSQHLCVRLLNNNMVELQN